MKSQHMCLNWDPMIGERDQIYHMQYGGEPAFNGKTRSSLLEDQTEII